jgi:beta-mannosidase
MEPTEALAVLKLMDFSGDLIWVGTHAVKIHANSSRCFFEADVEGLLRGHAPNSVVLSAELYDGEELLSKSLLYFVPPKELELPVSEAGMPAPAVSIASVSENDDGYSIALCAQSLVKNLFLFVRDYEGVFDDNYFDMLPGSCITVHFVTPDRINDMNRHLTMRSLVDTY